MILITLGRIKRVVSLDEKVYSEIAEDKGALVQAIIVVYLAMVIGEMILTGALLEWFVWTGIMHIVAKLLGGKADFVSYLKVIGFAEAPRALGVIPSIGWIIGFIWFLACCLTATKVVHRLSTGKAIVAVIAPIIVVVLIGVIEGVISSLEIIGTEAY